METFDFSQIEKILSYTFKDKMLLKNAFIHSSYANEHKCHSNERLEFLGDSVLSIIVTDHIYHHYKKAEGDLSKIRASLVSEKSLCFVMEQLKLGKYVLKGVGLKNSPPTDAMLADAFEAVVAAIYLDGGLQAARKFVLSVLESAMLSIDKTGVPDSSKSKLQELLPNSKIIYQTNAEGEGLGKIYVCKVLINGIMSGIGSSNKKKTAEEIAAKEALTKVKKV